MSELIEVVLDDATSIAEGDKRSFKAGAFDVLVCRVKDTLYALEDLCSHQDTPLCGGRLVGHLIICPKHNAQFDVRDGSHKSPPAYKGVTRFELEQRVEGVVVRVPAQKKPKDLGIGGAPLIRTR
ncbi:MAG: Rieske 2Fe-2S domain-containing protein [Gammaproteobacteria bacterium]|nr:Rieske 2Fe-2S domain-containing protein [Gammaproteobacteria bacterium]